MKTLAIAGLLLVWVAPAAADKAKTVHREVPAKQAHEIYRYHQKDGFKSLTVLDVRPPAKRKGGVIKGAVSLPFEGDQSNAALEKLPGNRAYLVYCGDGKRGARTMEAMRALHFREVYNIKGGLTAWKQAGYAVVPPDPPPPPPKLPWSRDRVCKTDQDCAVLPRICHTCPPCEPTWREVGNRAAHRRRIDAQRRVRCAAVRCRPCASADNWLGDRLACVKGQCAYRR